MSNGYLIMFAIGAGLFFYLWKKGHLLRFADYVSETKIELKKCTWPTRDELKSSTLIVLLSTLMLGVFTVIVDWVIVNLMRLING